MDGIAKALNTTYEPETSITEIEEVKNLSGKVSEIKTSDTASYSLEDKKYLKQELYDIIQSVQSMRKFLEEQIMRPPIRASEVEAYSTVLRELKDAIKELRILNIDIVNTERKSGALIGGNTNIQNNLYMLDSKSLDMMIENAQKNKAIDSIKIDFKQDDQIK